MTRENRTALPERMPGAVADDHVPAPGTAVVFAQVDERVAVRRGVLDHECPVADGVQALPAERTAAEDAVGDALMCVKAGEMAVLEEQVAAEIRSDQPPVAAVHDVGGLRTAAEGQARCRAAADVVRPHRNGFAGTADGAVDVVSREYAVVDVHIRAVADVEEAFVRCAVVDFAGDEMSEAGNLHVRA